MASSRVTAILTSLLPLALCTIAFAFAITATISPEWATRQHYNSNYNEEDWSPATQTLTETRSPFIVCGTRPDENRVLQLVCESYINSVNSSCSSWNVTGSNSALNYGDARLCQQIHWSGNLAIASTTFIGLGFLVTLSMSLVAALALLSPGSISANSEATSTSKDESTTITATTRPEPRHRHKYLSPAAPYCNAFLIAFLIIGAILYVLAQFYGVLAFVQSAPDNGAFAAYGAMGPNGQGSDHSPWIQGKALSIYGSVAWFGALLTALCASWVWRLPAGRQSPL